MIKKAIIDKVIHSFYEKAKRDILIGYHFRVIHDFDTHIPRIADFWNLQLNGALTDRSNLPFKLLEVHKPLGIKIGEINRWIVLFTKTLDEFKQEISDKEREEFMKKVNHFKDILILKFIR